MGRTALATFVLISLLLAGCFGAPSAGWGDDNGELMVTWDQNPESLVKVSSNLDGETTEMELAAQGCDDAGDVLKTGTTGEVTQPVRVSGWLIASQHFPDGAKGEPSQKIIPTAVLIGLDSFDVAKDKTFEDYDKFTIKDWSLPTSLSTMPKLDSSSLDHTKYGVVGLIPANEDILEGFSSLDDWHQSIEIEGYAVNTYNPTASVLTGEWSVKDGCRAITLAESGIAMVVTQINFENSMVSLDGKGSSEWSKGDVPFIGTYLYFLLVMIAGGGGAFLLFTFSVGMERHGAKTTARAMLTDAQIKMAKIVRKDVKKAKKEGVDMSAGSMIATEEKEESVKVTQKLDTFDVESVLGTLGDGRSQGAELGGGGVVLTDSAYDMGDQLQESMDTGGVNLGDSTERVGHTLAFDIDDILNPQAEDEDDGYYEDRGPSPGPQRSSKPPSDRKTVTGRKSVSSQDRLDEMNERVPAKRRSVRKTKRSSEQGDSKPRKGPPERKGPAKKKPSISDDDDFSDFSF